MTSPSDEPPTPSLAELEVILKQSRADIAAGRTVPASSFLQWLDEKLESYEDR